MRAQYSGRAWIFGMALAFPLSRTRAMLECGGHGPGSRGLRDRMIKGAKLLIAGDLCWVKRIGGKTRCIHADDARIDRWSSGNCGASDYPYRRFRAADVAVAGDCLAAPAMTAWGIDTEGNPTHGSRTQR